ncbi:hypothetical protein KMW28_15505 [Flammeovirga yaeyamensis]|uniref:Uncharacterized protein n=1 Tax=Flammeovirga yaeyamensis TaxID=367791 RepID=A0AAX1N5A6_9BACT|nr:hypothetical protein [Flammeovirga yaeyamensis]MBB3698581.1 hypothetical protein [Flammeovirga yaeyamensis]NMF34070.1 hypothetical protein [Flammeovirga yaeyamensis]QWG01058.1 hypothetical protein KMW28_15505 [Flammeovirga yaeyamensis]
MDENNKHWLDHFDRLEMKTLEKKALKVMRNQSILLMEKMSLQPRDILGGMWASMHLDTPLFGALFLLEDKVIFVGGHPSNLQLQTLEWPWGQIEKFQKLEDPKLGIVKILEMYVSDKKIRFGGMKGFVPSSFILILEKIWFDHHSN